MSDTRSEFEAAYRARFNVPAHVPLDFPDVARAWVWWQAATERAAKIADGYAKRDFPWASENSDTYHAQADWAQLIAAAIRGTA